TAITVSTGTQGKAELAPQPKTGRSAGNGRQFRHSSPVSIGSQLDRLSVLGSFGRSDSDLHYSDAHGRSANPSNSDSAARTPTVKHWTRAYSDWTRTGRTWPS